MKGRDTAKLELAAKRSTLLLELYGAHAVRPRPGSSSQDDWRVVGPALVARCAYLLGSILKLQQDLRGLDAILLLRAMFEHTVMVAWLAADPAENVRRFLASDLQDRLRFDDDVQSVGFPPLLSPEARTLFETDASGKKLPSLKDRVVAADKYWAGRSRYLRSEGQYSLRAEYALAYRSFSSVAHPTCRSLYPFVIQKGGLFSLTVPSEPAFDGAFTSAPLMFATALIVLGEATGWIVPQSVAAIFEKTQPAAP